MYAGINTSNGVLTIRGGEGNSSDVIRLGNFTFQGTEYIAVSVDVGDDVPGTRHLAGAGNLPQWLSSFPAGSVFNIVINGGAGQDFIRIEGNAGKPVTVERGMAMTSSTFLSEVATCPTLPELLLSTEGPAHRFCLLIRQRPFTKRRIPHQHPWSHPQWLCRILGGDGH